MKLNRGAAVLKYRNTAAGKPYLNPLAYSVDDFTGYAANPFSIESCKAFKPIKLIAALFVLLSLAFALTFNASAENRLYVGEVMAQETFTDSSGTVLPYRIYIPPSSEKESPDKLPLLLYLHGSGHRGNDNILQAYFEPGILYRVLNSKYSGCILVAPQCAQNMQWVNTPWDKGSYDTDKIDESDYQQAVLLLLISLIEDLPVDSNRVYVTGISMGGYGTWDIILRHPELFAAAVPVCGAGDPAKAERISKLPVWFFHGADDDIVPVSGSRDMAAALDSAGSALYKYTEYPGVDHSCWTEAYSEQNLLDWLFAQSREETTAPPENGGTYKAIGCALAVLLIAAAGLVVIKAIRAAKQSAAK